MFDNYIKIQNIAYNILKNSIKSDKISHAYLIETQGNDYGFDFALSFAKALLCPKRKTNNKQCFNCNQCQAIDDNNFIELEIVDTDDLWLKKENIEILQKNFNFKPIVGKLKIYIIKNADKIRENLANTLLKFIEEPEQGIVAILVTDNKARILDTIISRCQVISLKCDNKDNLDSELKKYDENIILTTIKFINYYEKNGLDTLLYTNSLFHDNLSDRNDYNIAFNIIIMYYKEILNYKLNNKLTNFIEYKDHLEEIIGIVKLDDAIKKIDIALNLKKTIGNNVNINLLVDKLIIDFAKVDQNEKC